MRKGYVGMRTFMCVCLYMCMCVCVYELRVKRDVENREEFFLSIFFLNGT